MPVSRILYPDESGHLSFICDTDCSAPVAPNPPMCPPTSRGTRPSRSRPPVYMGLQSARFARPVCLHDQAVRSYRTFSPFPPDRSGGGYFLWHCLVFAWANSPDVIGMRRSALSGLSSSRFNREAIDQHTACP
jgi:hypothetical protein